MEQGVHLVWSSVHIHLSLHAPDKGVGLLTFLQEMSIPPAAVAAIGDAPNDSGERAKVDGADGKSRFAWL